MSRNCSALLRGVASVLRPEAYIFSPAVGLLSLSAPAFLANLRGAATSYPCPGGALARELFHQRLDSSDRRMGPVAVTRSKSRAAYWLTPASMGHLVGLAVSERAVQGDLTDKDIDDALAGFGVECNTVNGEWTGVSMERFRQLVRLIGSDYRSYTSALQSQTALPPSCGYVFPVLSHFVWDKAVSKRCVLDHLLAIEASSGREILTDACAELRVEGSIMQRDWLGAMYPAEDAGSGQVNQALSLLMEWADTSTALCPLDGCVDATVSSDSLLGSTASFESGPMAVKGKALEILALSVYRERVHKLPIRLGRYAASGGPLKPDCVEVAMREVVDALIFNPETASLDTALLPTSCAPPLRMFYESFINNQLSDIPLMTRPQKGKNSKGRKKNPAVMVQNEPPSEQTSAGAEWFRLCSGLDGGNYLSVAPDGTYYELKPGLRNVSRVLGILLGAKEEWSSFKHLEEFWNNWSPVCNGAHIRVEEKIVSFRAPLSDTENIHREMAFVHISGGSRRVTLEVELEAAHNLATVRQHSHSTHSVWVGPIFQRRLAYWACNLLDKNRYDVAGHLVVPLELLHTALLGDLAADICIKDLVAAIEASPGHRASSADSISFRKVLHSLLSTRWGGDRKNALLIGETGATKLTSASAVSDLETSVENSKQSYLGAIRAVYLCTCDDSAALILRWLLLESQGEETTEELARAFENIPLSVIARRDVQTVLASRPDAQLLEEMVKKQTSVGDFFDSVMQIKNARDFTRVILFQLKQLWRNRGNRV